jgi:hypothetical protein
LRRFSLAEFSTLEMETSHISNERVDSGSVVSLHFITLGCPLIGGFSFGVGRGRSFPTRYMSAGRR